MNTIKIISLATAAFASLSTAGTLNAATVDRTTSVEVDIKGIDLGTPAGVKRVTAIVRAAAHQVCTNGSGSNDLNTLMFERSCFNKAFNEAQQQIQTKVARYRDNKSRVASAETQNGPFTISR